MANFVRKKIMEKKLNHYDVSEVIDTFDIDRVSSCVHLNSWIAATGSLEPWQEELLKNVHEENFLRWDEWNEEELKMKFVSLILFLSRIDEYQKVHTFFERPMVGVVGNVKISIIVDCMVATPKKSGNPKMPYFFMQEFKRSKGDSHDPEGQMLAAMILAQELNQDGKPLYGCWIQGSIWRFTVLNGSEYCVSRAFDAAQESDLLQIVFILRKLKELILNRAISE
jgi:hypothetical protein